VNVFGSATDSDEPIALASLVHYIATRGELMRRAGDVLGWIQRGELEIRIGATFPLAEAAQAHRELEDRRTTGKVLLLLHDAPLRRCVQLGHGPFNAETTV
jgi:hypothetical protein